MRIALQERGGFLMRIGSYEENQNDMTLAVPFDTDISRAYQDLGWGHGATSQKWWFERPAAGRVVLWSLSLCSWL